MTRFNHYFKEVGSCDAVFLELVEFKAKPPVLPFFIGVCYSWYNYQTIHLGYVLLYFIAMLIFNMAVDILDNYNDYHHATEGHDYKENQYHWSGTLSVKLVFDGLHDHRFRRHGNRLAMVVGWPLFWMGLYCYLVRIFYSSGPRPLSSLPLGEFFSGFTMGFMISLICVYLNAYQTFEWNIATIGKYFLDLITNTLWIANLMLANNICDLEEDEKMSAIR